ncbi:MAG: hypothetical protein OMM_03469 [Candidatus Magnetoglobus multicellularis str. Araruama]|uniref:Uncharacterized protein n=1 Tax=Candidatus Magnetoglobus multicellularis str. Araruama TaxID=890399 RepID=A0A1V1P5H4_9BACT|nr:MAG: hypothetical protein OMM_03469 [Candidatus Magnetoglobus multicellularis str. Araruama]
MKITGGRPVSIFDDYAVMCIIGKSALIFKKDDSGWIQETALTGSGDAYYDRLFGKSVSIDGDYIIVGASTDYGNRTLPGSAYIYQKLETGWVNKVNIVPGNGGDDDRFGNSVSISGSWAIVGAPYFNNQAGAAYIFKKDGDNWVETDTLSASLSYDTQYVYFGKSVSISGDYAIVSAYQDAYIFKRVGDHWYEETILTDENSSFFANQVAISGNYILLNASGQDNDGNYSNYAYIYQFDGSNWLKQTKLIPDDITQNDYFGSQLSLSNDYAIFSSTDNDIGEAAYIFKRTGDDWNELVKLMSSDSNRKISFANSVAISEKYAIVATGSSTHETYIYHAPFDDRNSRTIKPLPPTNGQILPSSCIAVPYSENQAFSIIPDSGYKIFDVKVDEKSVGTVSSYTFYNITDNHIISASFVLSDAVFVTENGKNVLPDDISNSSIKAYGDYLIIGSGYYNSGDGIAYILKRNDMDWVIQSTLLPDGGPDLFTDYKDQFGYSVSIEENYAVVGAAYDDNNIGGCPGSVYVYKREDNTWSQQTKLTLPNGTLYDNFGWKVAVFGDHIIAATAESNKSNVYYFKRNGEYWVLQNQALHFSEYVTDLFLTENYAFVSMTKEGYVYIYELQNENWIEIDRLRSPDYQEYDYFGSSLAVFNDYVFVGATRGDSNQADTGAVYVYKKGTYRWVYQEKLVAKDAEQYDQFGNALAIASTRSGDYLFVGARSDNFDFLENTGSVYSFKFDGNNWVEQSKLIISDGKEYEMLGTSIFTSDQYAFVFKDKDPMMFDYAESAIYSYVYPFNGQSADEAPQFYQESSDIEMQTHGNTEITVSDANGGILTICAESSNETIIPNAFISLSGSGSNIYSINTRSDMPQVLSMTFFQTSTHYGDISIHVMITDATGLTATQSFSVRVEPYQCLDCNDDNKDCTRFDIAAAGDYFLILKPDGTVWGWGNNYFGQLGNGFFDFYLGNVNPSHSSHWLQVQNLSDVVAISASSHNLALRSDGSVWSWGFNNRGQLGNGNNTDQNIPVQVINLTDVIDIACGYFHSLAIK